MLPNLYPLRFILAVLVILYHIPIVSKTLDFPFYKDAAVLNKGHLSVFYFFTLSGFLIIRLIYQELKKTGGFDFKTFYLRRVQRLYPVYYLVLFIGILLYHFVLPALDIYRAIDYELPDLLLAYIFFIPNIFQYYYNPGSIVQIMWSIGVEEQFYLFIPALLYLGRKNIVSTLALVFAISIVVLFINTDAYIYRNYYFYFLFGGLCAVVSEKYRFALLKNKMIHVFVYGLFVLSFTTSWFEFENEALYHFVNMVISGFTLTLITYYALFRIENKLINYLGKISYGIYMYHMIIVTGLFFTADQLHIQSMLHPVVFIIGFNTLAIVFTTLVSALSYEYFEKLFYSPRVVSDTTSGYVSKRVSRVKRIKKRLGLGIR